MNKRTAPHPPGRAPSLDADLHAADAGLKSAALLAADGRLDLRAAAAATRLVDNALTASFHQRLVAQMPQGAAVDPVAAILLGELARVQAELFVLKAAMAGDDAARQSGESYRDPLLVLQDLLGVEERLARATTRRAIVSLAPQTLGYGWHAPEQGGNGGWIRWSGPGRRSGLMVPAFGAVPHAIRLRLHSPIAANLDAFDIRLNRVPVDFTRKVEGSDLLLHGVFTPAADAAQRFFALLEWEVPEVRALREFSGTDERLVGFALFGVEVESLGFGA